MEGPAERFQEADKSTRLRFSEIWANWTAEPGVCFIGSPAGAKPQPARRASERIPTKLRRLNSYRPGMEVKEVCREEGRKERSRQGKGGKTGGKGGRRTKGTKNKGVRKMEGKEEEKKEKGGIREKKDREESRLIVIDAPPLVSPFFSSSFVSPSQPSGPTRPATFHTEEEKPSSLPEGHHQRRNVSTTNTHTHVSAASVHHVSALNVSVGKSIGVPRCSVLYSVFLWNFWHFCLKKKLFPDCGLWIVLEPSIHGPV